MIVVVSWQTTRPDAPASKFEEELAQFFVNLETYVPARLQVQGKTVGV